MKPGIVYFIQQNVTWAVKIGFTASEQSLTTRLSDLQTGSPYPLRLVHFVVGTVDTERAMHGRFEADRLCGEWFSPSVALAQAISDSRAASERLKQLESQWHPIV